MDTDARFAITGDSECAANKGEGSSDSHFHNELEKSNRRCDNNSDLEDEDDEVDDDADEEGFDEEGLAGQSGGRVVKPLTPEALAAFNAAQEKAGIIYISRIPPGMRPTKVRHLMTAYGEVGRVYLQQEGEHKCTRNLINVL